MPRDVGDDAFGVGVKRAGHEHDRGEARGGSDPRYEWFHRSLQLWWPATNLEVFEVGERVADLARTDGEAEVIT